MITNWMSWEGGVDIGGSTQAGLEQPNFLVHVARMVHTPVGSAPSGMVLYQPDFSQPPAVVGFVSGDPEVGAYFGPRIFAGTPFEHAPVLPARIEVTSGPSWAAARVEVGEYVFETRLEGLGATELIHREPGALAFAQQGLEAVPAGVTVRVNGQPVEVAIPPVGLSGGPAAVWSACGIYAR